MTTEELLNEAINYLDYIGWGDSWEREAYGDVRKELQTWQINYEADTES